MLVTGEGAIAARSVRGRFARVEELLSPAGVQAAIADLYCKLCQPDADGNGHFDQLAEDDFALVLMSVELVLLRTILMADVLPRSNGADATNN